MCTYLALKNRRDTKSSARSSLSSSSSGISWASWGLVACSSGSNWAWLKSNTITQLNQLRSQLVNYGSNGLANQSFAEAIHVFHRKVRNAPVTLADKSEAKWFTERVKVSVEDVLEVRDHCGHVGKVLVAMKTLAEWMLITQYCEKHELIRQLFQSSNSHVLHLDCSPFGEFPPYIHWWWPQVRFQSNMDNQWPFVPTPPSPGQLSSWCSRHTPHSARYRGCSQMSPGTAQRWQRHNVDKKYKINQDNMTWYIYNIQCSEVMAFWKHSQIKSRVLFLGLSSTLEAMCRWPPPFEPR